MPTSFGPSSSLWCRRPACPLNRTTACHRDSHTTSLQNWRRVVFSNDGCLGSWLCSRWIASQSRYRVGIYAPLPRSGIRPGVYAAHPAIPDRYDLAHPPSRRQRRRDGGSNRAWLTSPESASEGRCWDPRLHFGEGDSTAVRACSGMYRHVWGCSGMCRKCPGMCRRVQS